MKRLYPLVFSLLLAFGLVGAQTIGSAKVTANPSVTFTGDISGSLASGANTQATRTWPNLIASADPTLVNATYSGISSTGSCANPADPTGVNDSTCAINAAISYSEAHPINGGYPAVHLPVGKYKVSSALSAITEPINITGDGANSTIINYTATSGTLFTFTTGGVGTATYGLRDLSLLGPGGTNTAQAVQINGAGVMLRDVGIGNGTSSGAFNLALSFGSNSYLDRVENSEFWGNNQAILYPSGLSNSGENIDFINSTFANSPTFANCVEIGNGPMQAADFRFISDSFDNCQLANFDNRVYLYSPHFEALTAFIAPFVTSTYDNYDGFYSDYGTSIFGGEVVFDSTESSVGVFEVERWGDLELRGVLGGPTVPWVYATAGTGGTPILKIDMPGVNQIGTSLYTVASGTSMQFLSAHTGAVNVEQSLKMVDQGQCTMTSGVCSAQKLSHTYAAAPQCFANWTGTGTLTGILKILSTTTTVTPESSIGTDSAQVNWVCFGN